MNPILRILIGGACIVIILAGIRAASSIVGTMLLSVVLAMSITPVVNFLIDKGVKRSLALLITIIVILVFGVLLISILGSSTVELARVLPTYESRLDQLVKSGTEFLARFNINANDLFSIDQFDPRNILQFVTPVIGGIVNVFSSSLFIILLIVLMIVEFSSYEQRLKHGELKSGTATARMYEVRIDIRKYLSITALTGFMASVANVLLLLALGVEFAVLWGVLYFFFNFVPVIGAVISTVLPALFALLQFGWTQAIIVLVGFTLFNNIADNVIKPKLMQDELEISLLMIFISLIFWNFILGPLGSILAIPLTITIKRIYQEFAEQGQST